MKCSCNLIWFLNLISQIHLLINKVKIKECTKTRINLNYNIMSP